MIRQVEELRAKFQVSGLRRDKILEQRPIDAAESRPHRLRRRAAQRRKIRLPDRCRGRRIVERRRIQSLIDIVPAAVNILIGNV